MITRPRKTKAVRFLNEGDKVKASLRFKGRQMAHRELGYAIINRLIQDMGDTGIVEFMPRMEGTTLHAILAPGKKSEAQRVPKPARPKPPAAQQVPASGAGHRAVLKQREGFARTTMQAQSKLREPAHLAHGDGCRPGSDPLFDRRVVRGLQHEYSERQREQALASVFTPDTQLISDGTYFVLEPAEGSFWKALKARCRRGRW